MQIVHRIIVCTALIICSTSSFFNITHAQDVSERKQLSFPVRAVTDPPDPDPTNQTDEERTAVIRQRTKEAIGFLKKNDLESFFEEYVDPFWLARGAVGGKVSVNELFEKRIVGAPDQTAEMMEIFVQVLEASLKQKPQYLLDGRAASFMEGTSSHTAEFWIYSDGKWRISPET